MSPVKKPVAILLLLLVCLLSCMLPLRSGLKQAAKAIMHQRLQQESAKVEATVIIAATELTDAEWEDDHEFRLGGHMYDVAGIEYRAGLKYYRCVTDDLEMQMERSADDITGNIFDHGRNRAQGRFAQSFLDWLQSLYFQPGQVPDNYLLPGMNAAFFAAAAHTVEDPVPNRRIIPPEA